MVDVDLTTEIAGISFKNPVAASPGIITQSVHSVRKCVEAGVGAVATKSITFVSRSWSVPRPAIWLLDKYGDPGSSVNISLGNFSIEQGVEFIQQIKPITKAEGVVLIATLGLMRDLEEYTEDEALELAADSARKLELAGADMIEAQRACPIEVGESGGDWAKVSDVRYYERIVRTLKASVSIPVFLKISTDVMFPNVKRLEDAGVDAHLVLPLVAGATIDIETGKPVVPFVTPFGRTIKAHANYLTAKFAQMANRPVIGTAGVMNSRDVIERAMCGATIVKSHTAAMRYGPKVYTEMIGGLQSFLARKGYRRFTDIVGSAAPYVGNTEEFSKFVEERRVPREAMALTINKTTCTGCEECTACPYGAMTMANGYPKWNSKECEFCGICQSICAVDSINIKRRSTYRPSSTEAI